WKLVGGGEPRWPGVPKATRGSATPGSGCSSVYAARSRSTSTRIPGSAGSPAWGLIVMARPPMRASGPSMVVVSAHRKTTHHACVVLTGGDHCRPLARPRHHDRLPRRLYMGRWIGMATSTPRPANGQSLARHLTGTLAAALAVAKAILR